jgi:tripartite-type tricarboxylate transporter receptor subunit TctC
MEQLKVVAGIDMVHVPYQGSGPSVTDLLAGRIQVIWSSTSSLIPYLKTGRLKALAVGGPQRLATMPDVPTIVEAGLPQYEPNMPWFSIFVPAGTPKPIITRINAELATILKDPSTVKSLTSFGYTPHPSTPEELGTHLVKEYARMKKLIEAIKLNDARVH